MQDFFNTKAERWLHEKNKLKTLNNHQMCSNRPLQTLMLKTISNLSRYFPDKTLLLEG